MNDVERITEFDQCVVDPARALLKAWERGASGVVSLHDLKLLSDGLEEYQQQMSTRWYQYFGTPERTAQTLFSIKFDNAKLFDKSEQVFDEEFIGHAVYKGSLDRLRKWINWLNAKCDE